MRQRFCSLVILLCFLVSVGRGQDGERQTFVGADDYPLDCRMTPPTESRGEDAQRAIILVHGSGAHSFDADLTAVTKDGKPNLLFKELSEALAAKNFHVFRYNKRNYQLQQDVKSGALAKDAAALLAYRENPVRYHIEDALAAVREVRRHLPTATIYLLGHSEGTYTALQAARQTDQVAGVACIGFAQYSTDLLVFEQTVYRPLSIFRKLDSDTDGLLTDDELAIEDLAARQIRLQKQVLDIDGDGVISQAEFQAVNLAGSMVQDIGKAFRKQEAEYPRSSEIVLNGTFKVAFFQGLLDNQTPAYHALALQLLMKQMGKSDRAHFHFFAGLGHALDRRENYDDLQFDTIDRDALQAMVTELDSFFVPPDLEQGK